METLNLLSAVQASALATELYQRMTGHLPRTVLGRAWIAGTSGMIRERMTAGETIADQRVLLEVALGLVGRRVVDGEAVRA
jgi:hypothetical protein